MNLELETARRPFLFYTYNALGQLVEKGLGDVSTVEQTYNIQGWLTDQTSRNFTMKLDYFDGKYAGNITKWSWGHGATTDQHYTLAYDAFNRLTAGTHSLNLFNETGIIYDLNGNIGSLSRKSNNSVTPYGYSYRGNQMISLSQAAGYYTYDVNGNMTYDPRRGLYFSYNSLNLVQEVKSGSIVRAKYHYAADGTKLKVQDAAGTNGYDYLGSVTLVKNANVLTPETAFAEGIIRGTEIMFFEKDHLGSVRSVLNASGQVIEKNDYYPFGMRHYNSAHTISANNRFKFNGMEDQTTGSIGSLDYGARMYDPVIGRWFNMDKLAEKYFSLSPFNYCANNPVNAIDPDGNLIIYINGFHDGFTKPKDYYWTSTFKRTLADHLNDYSDPMYIDGSYGGSLGAVGFMSNLNPRNRYMVGFREGGQKAEEIIARITVDGKISETIKIITHSMGAAYAKGFVKALLKYFEKNGIDPRVIEFEADFAPYQPRQQEAVDGVPTYQFFNKHDLTANNGVLSREGAIKGAIYSGADTDKDKGHRPSDFTDKIMSLPAGSYEVINGEIIPK